MKHECKNKIVVTIKTKSTIWKGLMNIGYFKETPKELGKGEKTENSVRTF